MKKMGDVAGEGRTILFVSHNMGAVQTVCRRALLLAHGEVKMMGTVPEVVAEYLKVSDALDGVPLADRRDRTGDGRFRFEEFRLLDARGRPASGMVTGEDCYLCLRLSTPPAAGGMTSPLDVAVVVRDFQGRKLTEVTTFFTNSSPKTVAEAREVCCMVPRVPLLAGQYRIDLWCGTAGGTQEWSFRETNPVLSGNRSSQRDHLVHKLLHRRLGSTRFDRVGAVIHDVDVQVAIGEMPECWDMQTAAAFEGSEEPHEFQITLHWHNDVLIELCVAQLEHCAGALATN